jgi:hypothetical protein
MEHENQMENAALCAWVTTYHTQKNTDCQGEFVLPDYYGDIRRVLCLRTKVHSDGAYQNGNRLHYEGVVQFSVLYMAEDDRVQNATFTLDYHDDVAWEETQEEQVLCVNPSVMQSSCRVQSARKISFKAKIATELLQRAKRCVAPRILGASGVEEEATVVSLQKECQTMDFRAATVRDLPFSYEMECEGTLAPIGEICFSELELRFSDCRPSPDGLLCEGSAFLQCLYRLQGTEEQPQYENLSRTFPVSVTLPDQDFGEGYTYRAIPCVRVLQTEVRENAYGEARIVTLNAEYDLQLEAAQNQTVTTVEDAYSTAYPTDLEPASLAAPYLVGVYSASLTVNEGKMRPEVGAEGAQSVTMLTADPKILKSEYDPSAQKLTFDGEIAVGALLSNGEGAAFTDSAYRIPFHMEMTGIRCEDEAEFRYDCRVLDAKGRLDADRIYANVELGFDVMVSAVKEVSLLESVTLHPESPYEKEDAICVYYPQGREDLWQIAKRYHTTKEALCQKNHLDAQSTTCDQTLLL